MDIFKNFANRIRESLIKNIDIEQYKNIEEIRIRNSKRIYVKLTNRDLVIDYIVKTEDVLETVQLISENSIYSYQNQICNGYITIKGGHRVGISGNVAIENNKVININYIYSLNFRIAKEITGVSEKIIKYIYNFSNDTIYNTLIVGKPASGKTTLLRDLIRNISSGKNNTKEEMRRPFNVSVVDERSEISAMYKGVPQNDLGERVDILENIPKILGIKLMIRSMAPDVIVADEIGGIGDTEIINYAICSGVRGIFTAHGDSLESLYKNPEISNLINMNLLERIIVLSSKEKGNIQRVYRLENKKYV
ncbi:MAG: stage III sporulation protein AA [Clostridia bacterium]|nr:stage III sporulation protein AA [Clostridia bacterium]